MPDVTLTLSEHAATALNGYLETSRINTGDAEVLNEIAKSLAKQLGPPDLDWTLTIEGTGPVDLPVKDFRSSAGIVQLATRLLASNRSQDYRYAVIHYIDGAKAKEVVLVTDADSTAETQDQVDLAQSAAQGFGATDEDPPRVD